MIIEGRLAQCVSCRFIRTFHHGPITYRDGDRVGHHRRKKKNHYEILGLENKASPVEIRAAFLKLSKEIHPDLNPNDPANHDKFVRLNEAYTILNKRLSRQEYDTSLSSRLYYEDTLFKHGYHSYTAGETSYPGPGTWADQGDGFDAQQRVYWEETQRYMRNNAYYAGNSPPMGPRAYLIPLLVSLGFVGLGVGYFFLALGYSYKQFKHVDEETQRTMAHFDKTKSEARKHTRAEQLQKIFPEAYAKMTLQDSMKAQEKKT